MPLVSGKTGTLTYSSTAHTITDWTLSLKTEVTKFGTSASGGWKTGVPGTQDASGSATLRPTAAPPPRNTVASMILKHGDWDGTGDRTYTFDAVITDVTIAVNVDTGEAVSATVAFEAVGPVTEAST
jgi:hypothetical protein